MSILNKLLIANRGEIACRVIKTAKRMGIQTVVVYSDIDKDSMFVTMADQAYNIGPAPALQSYLRSDKIIDIALHTKAKAIHPGFGFLSENADFSDQCQKNNIIFVGPSGDAIRKMGSKSESKNIMTKANIPVVPGYHGENQDHQHLLEEAKKIGFPVLIKAVMGGGGKGMRIVRSSEQFLEGLESSKRESLKSFKDDRVKNIKDYKVLIEKYIEIPRHIEVQIFGDNHGNYVHFFERDCSIQRRHQKVIEEAPSALPNELRKIIGQTGIEAARAVKYTNAGTVEFIFDLQTNNYYFMEMNTRLQVEHPISEMITQTDLVEWQLKVANGERLPKTQEKIKLHGHSIEARIYSEQPNNDFLPGNGKLEFYREPKAEGSLSKLQLILDGKVRIETGVREKDEISIFYDPMISKLVVWGDTRQQAIRTLQECLRNYEIIGLPNNINFLKKILSHQNYQQWNYDTSFIDTHKAKLLQLNNLYCRNDIAYGIVVRLYQEQSKLQLPKGLRSFRNNHEYQQNFQILVTSDCYEQSEKVDATLTVKKNGSYQIQLKDNVVNILAIKELHSNRFQITSAEAVLDRSIFCKDNSIYVFDQNGDPIKLEFLSENLQQSSQETHEDVSSIKTPMPGTLSKLNVKVGDSVKKGQSLFILEAMKMEHTIKASKDGVIKELKFKEGQFIDAGSFILRIE